MSGFELNNDLVSSFIDKCYDSGIKDPVRFLSDKMPRLYGNLRGAFPRGILPTDIDGEVEINGYFLRLEFKHENALRAGRVPKGQVIAFKSLLRTGVFTVALVGHDDAGRVTCCETWTRNGVRGLEDMSDSGFFDFCKSWADFATDQTT